MLRVVLGLLKGGVVGAGIGYVAWKLGVSGGALAFATYGIVGALAGIVAGRPPWKQETLWTSLLKGLFGFGIGMLLYWAGHKLLGGIHVASVAAKLGSPDKAAVDIPLLLGPVVGAIWGILVEVDDSVGAKPAAAAAKAEPAAAPRK